VAAIPECLELPRPVHLMRTTGWNLAESFGLPLAAYAIAAWLWGRDVGVLAMLAAIWVTAGLRKLVTGTVPSLLTISMIVLTVQAVVAVATGNLWIFLVHFPLANHLASAEQAKLATGQHGRRSWHGGHVTRRRSRSWQNLMITAGP